MAKKKVQEDNSGPLNGPVFTDEPDSGPERSKMMNDRLMKLAKEKDLKVSDVPKSKKQPGKFYNSGQRRSSEVEEQRAPSWLAYRGIKAKDVIAKDRTSKPDKMTNMQNEAIVSLRNAYPKDFGVSIKNYNSQVTPGKFEYYDRKKTN